jgi:hypothetical protein
MSYKKKKTKRLQKARLAGKIKNLAPNERVVEHSDEGDKFKVKTKKVSPQAEKIVEQMTEDTRPYARPSKQHFVGKETKLTQSEKEKTLPPEEGYEPEMDSPNFVAERNREIFRKKPEVRVTRDPVREISPEELATAKRQSPLVKWFKKRMGLNKSVKSPSKHLSRDFIIEAINNNNMSPAGKEYHADELQQLKALKDHDYIEQKANELWEGYLKWSKQNPLYDDKLDKADQKDSDKISDIELAKQRAKKVLSYLKNMGEPDLSKDELEKASKNVRIQREKVFGRGIPSVNSPKREKQMQHIIKWAQQRYKMPVERAPGKLNVFGKLIDKPELSRRSIQHIGNPQSLMHELAHIEIAKEKMPPDEFQKWMDKRWGEINQQYGYKQQAREREEYESHGAENKLRRQLGLPIAERSTKETKPERDFAVDAPDLRITRDIPVKGGKTKKIYGLSANLSHRKDLFDRRQMGEQEFHPETGWVDSVDPDAIINRRARGDVEGARNLLRQKFKKSESESRPKLSKAQIRNYFKKFRK